MELSWTSARWRLRTIDNSSKGKLRMLALAVEPKRNIKTSFSTSYKDAHTRPGNLTLNLFSLFGSGKVPLRPLDRPEGTLSSALIMQKFNDACTHLSLSLYDIVENVNLGRNVGVPMTWCGVPWDMPSPRTYSFGSKGLLIVWRLFATMSAR